MPEKNRNYDLSVQLLQSYRDAALVNSQSLIEEATLLLAHKHNARAYFLAVSSIEEAGKGVQAFEGLGWNLRDPAVCQRLKLQFGDHSQKVTSAFSPWLQVTPNLRDEIMEFVNMIVAIKFGREASMYTEIDAESGIVTTPQLQVRSSTATDCVRLAGTVLSYVLPYVQQSQPKIATRVQNAFFALRPASFQKMANTSDFWEFYISQMEVGNIALDAAVTQYNNHYLSKGKLFKPVTGEG